MNRAHFHVSLEARSGPFPRGEANSRQASESLEPVPVTRDPEKLPARLPASREFGFYTCTAARI
jgi:hypothetical protein